MGCEEPWEVLLLKQFCKSDVSLEEARARNRYIYTTFNVPPFFSWDMQDSRCWRGRGLWHHVSPMATRTCVCVGRGGLGGVSYDIGWSITPPESVVIRSGTLCLESD